MLDYELLGAQVRKQRKLKGYTLEQLAEKLDISTNYIGQIERATGIPSLETLVNIANTLEVSVDSLLLGDLDITSHNAYFVNRVIELTEDFTKEEKDLLLKNIEIFKEFKDNA